MSFKKWISPFCLIGGALLLGFSSFLSASPSLPNTACLSFTEPQSLQLHRLFADYFAQMQRLNPELATYLGHREYNNYWTDYSSEGIAERQIVIANFLENLQQIDIEKLSSQDRLNYVLFQNTLIETLKEGSLNLAYMPLDQLGGIPLDIPSLLEMMPSETREDFQDIFARLRKIPKLLDQTIDLMNKGLMQGLTPPQICLHSLPKRINNLIPDQIEDSPFYVSFDNLSSDFAESEKSALQEQAKAILKDEVFPAYARLLQYVVEEYIPACRTTIGITDCPNGEEIYQFLVRSHTTTELSPGEIHQMGLTEVARIRKLMELQLEQLGFNGTYASFLHFLHSDPSFFYEKAEDLLEGYRSIAHTIDQNLPLLFNRLPILPYVIVPVPAHSEQSQVAAYYMAGSLQNGRPGRFYVNTYDLKSRPKWQMETLALHEAVPGHHFQISIAQEIENQPEFRKYARFTAYVEGWALYTEGLGSEVALYQDPFSQFGRHIEEIWRAVRLVVDTGMHTMGWSREKAIAYFKEHTGSGFREASTEIDRYIVWPGQALAYKVGELSILRWRNEAQKILGDEFDIKEFHDVLLSQGALPLDICERQMKEWVDSKWQATVLDE